MSTSLCATPGLASERKRWSDPFTGGGYHAWNPGSRPWEASESMLTPVEGKPLFVCGEAFSTTQGWIQGALETSEKVLEKMGKAPTSRLPE